ncbi:MAG: hypothetical protein ACI8TP_004093 [Acidimicrobiales bacterium]|jgi:uncharacterized protein (TIGR01777 family)
MDVVVTGSSGLIGSALMPALEAAGHRAIGMVRRTPAAGADEIRWDIDKGEIDAESLDRIDAVIHLGGAGIGDKRWNAKYKKLLIESRTRSTSLLASTLAGLNTPPKVFVSGSAIGFYGDRGNQEITEESSAGTGFLTDLVVKWEGSAQSAVDAGIRTVFARTGIVLSADGGALKKMLPLFKVGLGGKLGGGDQWMSWISIDDEVGALLHMLSSDLSGPVNLTAPDPVTNRDFTAALGRTLGRRTVMPVPAFGPRLLLGREMADALLFEGAKIEPFRLLADGYEFSHHDIETALRAVLGR